jgi:hypothetical protein
MARFSALNPNCRVSQHGIDGTSLVACLSYRPNMFSFPELAVKILFDGCERYFAKARREARPANCANKFLLSSTRASTRLELSNAQRSGLPSERLLDTVLPLVDRFWMQWPRYWERGRPRPPVAEKPVARQYSGFPNRLRARVPAVPMRARIKPLKLIHRCLTRPSSDP